MKERLLKIGFAGGEKFIVVPSIHAQAVAAMLADADVYVRDGYMTSDPLKKTDETAFIEFVDASTFAAPDPRIAEAEKRADGHRSDWYKEYQARQLLEKKLSEAKAAIEALQSAKGCALSDGSAAGKGD